MTRVFMVQSAYPKIINYIAKLYYYINTINKLLLNTDNTYLLCR